MRTVFIIFCLLATLSCKSTSNLKHFGVLTVTDPELYNSIGQIYISNENGKIHYKGTGFVFHSDDEFHYVATNYHVVQTIFESKDTAKIHFKTGNKLPILGFTLDSVVDKKGKSVVAKFEKDMHADFAILKFRRNKRNNFVKNLPFSSNTLADQDLIQMEFYGYPSVASSAPMKHSKGLLYKGRGFGDSSDGAISFSASASGGSSGSPIFVKTKNGFVVAGLLYAGTVENFFRADNLARAAEKMDVGFLALGTSFAFLEKKLNLKQYNFWTPNNDAVFIEPNRINIKSGKARLVLKNGRIIGAEYTVHFEKKLEPKNDLFINSRHIDYYRGYKWNNNTLTYLDPNYFPEQASDLDVIVEHYNSHGDLSLGGCSYEFGAGEKQKYNTWSDLDCS